MDDEYELVPKSSIKSLREENANLKNEIIKLRKNQKQESLENEEINKQDKEENNEKLIQIIIEKLNQESKRNNQEIIENLNQIKEFNRKTLDITLQTNKNMDAIKETIKELIKSLSLTIEDLHSKEIDNNSNQKQSLSEEQTTQINQKLTEIKQFMNNLELLLSQIKPSNMRM